MPRLRPRSSSIRRCSGQERLAVLFAAEGGEHARVVVERGDRGAEAAAERLASRAAAEVVVAARAGRLGDDLQLARVRLQLEHRLAAEVALERERLAVWAARVQLVEREPEPAQVLLPQSRGRCRARR